MKSNPLKTASPEIYKHTLRYSGGEMTLQEYYEVDEQPVLNEYGFAEER